MIQQTSLEAYEKLCADGTIHGDELKVLQLIREHGPITGREMEPMMGKPIHAFSGRITKLQARHLVRSAGLVKIDGSSMNAWVAVGVERMEAEKPDGERGGDSSPGHGGDENGRA